MYPEINYLSGLKDKCAIAVVHALYILYALCHDTTGAGKILTSILLMGELRLFRGFTPSGVSPLSNS